MTGTPGTVHKYAFLDGLPAQLPLPVPVPARRRQRRPASSPATCKPAAPGGGRWHSNGGGWVDARANVAATAYVGPRAAVYGSSTVNGNARDRGPRLDQQRRHGRRQRGREEQRAGAGRREPQRQRGHRRRRRAGRARARPGTYMMFVPDRGCDGDVGAGGGGHQPGARHVHRRGDGDQRHDAAAAEPATPTAATAATATPHRAAPTRPTAATRRPRRRSGAGCTATYRVTSAVAGRLPGRGHRARRHARRSPAGR